MSLIDRKEVKYALAALGVAALAFGIYRAYHYFFKVTPKPPSSTQETRAEDQDEQASEEDNELHLPYPQLLADLNNSEFSAGSIHKLANIKEISYKIILTLIKGSGYQGIVNLSFFLQSLKGQENLDLNFKGSGIKFLKVNNKTLEAREVMFHKHKITIPNFLLKEKNKNSIEIIFENDYSFLGNGMAAYFIIDDHNKYSLRQQVIYSVPGWNQIEHIIPCLNCTNECSLHLEVIHPDTFEVFANSVKELKRLCSVNDYQNYPFLFDLNKNLKVSSSSSLSLNGSQVLNTSKVSDTMSNYTSSTRYNGRKRANTHFHTTRLPSIHNFFVFCSAVTELQPSLSGSPIEEQVLLRYFCKYSQSHLFYHLITHLHNYVLQVYRKFSNQKIKEKVVKIDFLIINDREVDGVFAPGIIVLHEQTVKDIERDHRCFYLISRAIAGLLRLSNNQNVLSLSEILTLNYEVFEYFSDLRNYVYIQNMQYSHIRSLINDPSLNEYLTKNESHFLQYYAKELKYIIKQSVADQISFELGNIVTSMKKDNPEEFWKNLLSNYNFLNPLVIDPLVKVALNKIGVPANDDKLLEMLKMCLEDSKYMLHFYTDKQIADSLPKFIACEAEGLEVRLPKLRVLQKFKDYITQKYISYLPGKSNTAQAQAFYNQFKKFNEKKNFHHLQTLKNEVKRVCCFGDLFIRPERIAIDCSLPGWKLLKELKLYPIDPIRYNFLKIVDFVHQI